MLSAKLTSIAHIDSVDIHGVSMLTDNTVLKCLPSVTSTCLGGNLPFCHWHVEVGDVTPTAIHLSKWKQLSNLAVLSFYGKVNIQKMQETNRRTNFFLFSTLIYIISFDSTAKKRKSTRIQTIFQTRSYWLHALSFFLLLLFIYPPVHYFCFYWPFLCYNLIPW